MTEFRKTPLTRRTVLGAGLAWRRVARHAAVLRAQDKSLKVGVYGGYFKDSFDKNIFPEFTKATGIAVEFGRRADRRSLAGAARAGGQGRPGAGRPFDDVADLDAQGPVDRAVDADRHEQDQALRRPARPLRQQISGRPRRRHRRRRLVHHAGHQHQCLSDGARLPGRRSGTRPTPTSSVCWRSPPTRSCSKSPPRPSWAAPTRSTPKRAY